MAIMISRHLAASLTAQGLIPPRCKGVELFIPPDGAMVLRYEVFVTDEDLVKLGAAFTEMAEAIRKKKETVGA